MSQRLSENEEAVLIELRDSEEYCVNYAYLDGVKGMHRKELEPVIKHLKELGYITFWRGLMDDDGVPAGSGWCRSRAGNDYVEEHNL